MLADVSIIIIKLIINLISWYYYSCSAYYYFKTENLFDAQFDELENVYKITQETLARKFNFDCIGYFLILTLYVVNILVKRFDSIFESSSVTIMMSYGINPSFKISQK